MKRKLSTKILAAFLAVMMLVTSVPLTALAAFNDDGKDATVASAQAKMQEFENMFDASGTSYSNVSPAYTAFVNLQKALDSYQYGTGTKATVDNAISNLNTAMGNMVVFNANAMTGTAVPTFANCPATTGNMLDYAGEGYSNVLYAPQATSQGEHTSAAVTRQIYYGSDAVLLYNGDVNAVKLPVMISGNMEASSNGYSKERYLWSAYSANTDFSGDDSNWQMAGRWSGKDGYDANWSWSWWAGNYGGGNKLAGYDYATGRPGVITTGKGNADITSTRIPACNRGGSIINRTYSISKLLYMSNVLQLKTVPTGASQNYSLNWVITSGGDNNNDYSNLTASSQIHVVNYTYLTDAVAKTASGLRGTALSDFNEGGLANYFSVMDEAKTWNPNTYFNNNTTNGYSTCVADLTNLVDTKLAALPNESTADQYKDSADYEALRKAMDSRAVDYNKGVNTVYSNFDGFAELYKLAMAEMDNVVSNGYSNGTTVKTLADQISGYKLESNIKLVDASQLEKLIDAYNDYQKSLFVSTDACQAVIDNAIAEIWHGEAYKKTDALSPADADGVEQGKVDAQVALVADAMKALKLNYTSTTMTNEGFWSLDKAIALNNDPSNLKDGRPSTDFANYSQLESAVNDGIAYKAVLESQELISGNPATAYADYEAKLEAYRAKIVAIVDAYNHLSLSFFIIEDGAPVKTSDGIDYIIDNQLANNINRNFYLSLRLPGQNNVLIRRGHDAKSIRIGEAQIQYGVAVDGSKRANYLDSLTLNADNLTYIREIVVDSGDDLPATGDAVFNYPAQMYIPEGFGINNLKVVGYNQYYDAISNGSYGFYAYDEDGSTINEMEPAGDKYTKILSTTTGQSLKGGIFSHSNTSNHAGTVALSGDLYFNAPATTAKADSTVYKNKAELLSAYPGTNVIPVARTTSASHTFGGVYSWAANGGAFGTAYAGFGFAKCDTAYNIGATLIEAGDYFDFVALCELIVKNDSDRYTAGTMKTFTDAISAAKTYDYLGKEASIIIADLNTKYYLLRTALNNLTEKSYEVTFVTKDANGKDVITIINLGYNDTVANHAADFEKIDLTTTYQADNKTWSFSHFTPAFDENAIVRDNLTYTAVYEGKTNFIDFGTTDNAITTEYADYLSSLINIASYTYTVETLNTVKDAIAGLQFGDMPSDLMATAENVTAVNAEIASMKALLDSLTPANVDPSYKDSAVATEKIKNEAIKAHKADPDQYGVIPEFPVYEEVAITADVTATGWKYTDNAAIDTAIAEFLNALKLNDYTIYLNGTAVATLPYGTAVIVDSDGTVSQDVSNTDDNNLNCPVVNWKYSFAAPSTNNAATPSKYYVTAPSVGFKVQGDTYLKTENTQGAADTYVVKVVATTGNILDVAVTTGSYTLPTAPDYAFYKFNGFTLNDSAVSGTITVNKNITIVANYTPENAAAYKIDNFNSLADYDNYNNEEDFDLAIQKYIKTHWAAYNQRISLTGSADTYCWAILTSVSENADDENYDDDVYYQTIMPVYYGQNYSFYAYETYDFTDGIDSEYRILVPLTKAEYDAFIINQTVLTPVAGGSFDISLNDADIKAEMGTFLYAPDGTPILADYEIDSRGNAVKKIKADAPYAKVSNEQFAIRNSLGSATHFTIIGTFVIPEGYTIIENGFLFATNTDIAPGSMTLENAGNGYKRYKAPLYTSGNQFTTNIVNPGGSLSFTYMAYSIVKDASGNLITCYSSPAQIDNASF